jgi:dipeptidyl aminopeptidase/acylaminoacyl peptidase
LKKIPLHVLFGNPQRVSPQISPDGRYLAYLAPYEGVLNVWVSLLKEGEEIGEGEVLTQVKQRPILSYSWLENSQHLLYRQDSDGDENWHLYGVNLETKEVRDWTPFAGVQAQVVATEPASPDEILISMNQRNPQLHDVYRLKVKTGELTLEVENPGSVVGWIADSHLCVRASQSMNGEGETHIQIREGGVWKDWIKWGVEDQFSSVVAFSPEGDSLYVNESRGANTLRLVEISLKDPTQFKVLAEEGRYDVSDQLFHPTQHHLQAVAFLKERIHWEVLDEEIRENWVHASQAHSGDFMILSRNHEDTLWVTAFNTDEGAIPFYLYNARTQKSTFLFYNRPELERYKLAPMRPIALTARDGLRLEGYLTLPLEQDPQTLPLIVNVHGGPWVRDIWGYHPEAQWLASQGYACLQLNYRGSTGYGKDFVNAGNRQWSKKMHDDLLDGVAWVREQGYFDGKRCAIYGGSYGGYSALVGATFTPEVFTCAVSVVGPSNLVTLIRAIPPYWKPMKALFDQRVGNVDTEEEFLKNCSPLFKATEIRIPLMIVQGKNDPRVNQQESEQIVEALRQAGKEVDYVLYENEGHGFAHPENRLDFYGKMEVFLEKHLKSLVCL